MHLLPETANCHKTNKQTKIKNKYIIIATTIAEQLSGLVNTPEKGSDDNFSGEMPVCCCSPFPVQYCRQLHSIFSSQGFFSRDVVLGGKLLSWGEKMWRISKNKWNFVIVWGDSKVRGEISPLKDLKKKTLLLPKIYLRLTSHIDIEPFHDTRWYAGAQL